MESGQILHVREMFRKWMLQVKGSYRGQMQDGDHTDDITSNCLLSSSQEPSKCLFGGDLGVCDEKVVRYIV